MLSGSKKINESNLKDEKRGRRKCIIDLRIWNYRDLAPSAAYIETLKRVWNQAGVISFFLSFFQFKTWPCFGPPGHYYWLVPAHAFQTFKDYDAGLIALSFLQGSFAYGGWNFLNYITEELVDPHK